MAEHRRSEAGVQALIDRLRDQGVEAGKLEAERIVGAARREAERLLGEARAEAAALLERARADAENERAAAREAIRLAGRDAVLDLKADIAARFGAQLRRLVRHELEDPEMLRRLILGVAARAVPEAAVDEILVPAGLAAGGEDEAMDRLARELAGELLREGVLITPSEDVDAGIRVRISGGNLEVDLGERAVAALLLRHLLPRFRALLDGVAR